MALMQGFSLPRPRQLWRQVHWFIGITAGTLLMFVGLSGALLSLREELLDALNPGGRQVAASARRAPLAPAELLAAVQREWPDRAVGTLAVFNAPGAAARVIFAPRGGQPRGEAVYLDPYTAEALPPLKGGGFFEAVENLHRWLLLPRAPGRAATGALAFCLLVLALSGLYVRWPRQWRSWRAWLSIGPNLKGRAWLSRWHLVLGTCALPMYLVFAATGMYWAFDFVRAPVDGWLGMAPRSAAPAPRAEGAPPLEADIGLAWSRFVQLAAGSGGWSQAILRITGSEQQPSLQLTWLDADPAHERARNRMRLALPQARVLLDERYAAKSSRQRLLDAIYPLHMGTYFGLPGRAIMMLAALALAAFGITGWWLYLDRRSRRARAC